MNPELNDTVMFIRDVLVEEIVDDDNSYPIDEIRIGERGRVVEIINSLAGTKYSIDLFKKKKRVYNINPKEILVLENDDTPEKVKLT